ncbi:alpha-glycosidase [Spirochaetia bacterium]|nr:alpha-glycosidase [Spirochaetia bacterium]
MLLMVNCDVRHAVALPYCYFNRYRGKVILRVLSGPEVEAVSVIYGDPFDFSTGDRTWQSTEIPMQQQYEGTSQCAWRVEFTAPRSRRLKYGFRVVMAGESYYFSENGVEPYTTAAVAAIHNHFFYPFIHRVDSPSVPEWAAQTVWYQIFPERFCNGNPEISPAGALDWETGTLGHRNFFGGDLRGIRNKLNYIKELGITGLYLTPIFQSPSPHKYDTEDYYTIDKHFGDTAELKALVSEAHRLGIRVMLDAVFNHAGSRHPFWQDVLQNQEKSPYKDYFHIHHFPVQEKYPDSRNINFDTFSWTPLMPKWNTENPDLRRYLISAAQKWIRECDIDGWRLDVANEVSFDFWREFSKEIRAVKDDFYIVGEIWDDASNWINSGYFDATMNYFLSSSISDLFLKKNTTPDQWTERVLRVLERYSDLHNTVAFNLLDSHDTDRILTRAGGDKQSVKNAFTMLFLLPGSPCIYYGTEIGMEGGHDPDCRRPMIWNEQKQDKVLLEFFKSLISFRSQQIQAINSGEIIYKGRIAGGAYCWILNQNALSVLYSYDEPADVSSSGRLLFSTGPVQNGRMPAHTIAVYSGKYVD